MPDRLVESNAPRLFDATGRLLDVPGRSNLTCAIGNLRLIFGFQHPYSFPGTGTTGLRSARQERTRKPGYLRRASRGGLAGDLPSCLFLREVSILNATKKYFYTTEAMLWRKAKSGAYKRLS